MVSIRELIEPIARRLDDAAAAMHAVNIGADNPSGHQRQLRLMASSLRADAALNKWPASYVPEGNIHASSDQQAAGLETLPRQIQHLMQRGGIAGELDANGCISLTHLNAAAQDMEPTDRIAVKTALASAGRIYSE